MSPRVNELSFSRLDNIFANSTPTYIKYLDACAASMIEGKNDLKKCAQEKDCDAFSRVRHKLQPNLELMGLVKLKEELSNIEKDPNELTGEAVSHVVQDIENIVYLIEKKKKDLHH